MPITLTKNCTSSQLFDLNKNNTEIDYIFKYLDSKDKTLNDCNHLSLEPSSENIESSQKMTKSYEMKNRYIPIKKTNRKNYWKDEVLDKIDIERNIDLHCKIKYKDKNMLFEESMLSKPTSFFCNCQMSDYMNSSLIEFFIE